jgi:acyl-CoA thioesterase FadM
MDAYGHVNNAVYLNYLEEARDGLIEDIFGEAAYDLVIAHVSIDYRREITQAHGDVVVESRVTGWGRSSVRTADVITLPDGSVAAEGTAVLVARDPDKGSSRPLTDQELARLALEDPAAG